MTLAFLAIPQYFWHPYSGNGYQFWSGIGSDVGEVAIVGGLVTLLLTFWRHFNCHADGCWRLSWHTHADHAILSAGFTTPTERTERTPSAE